jgi:hypothetical protein
MAAVIVILLVIRVWSPFTTADRLFNTYYEPFAAANYSQRNLAETEIPNLSKGIQFYMEGEYNQSLLYFNRAEDEIGVESDVLLFRGLNYLGLEQYSVARDLFREYVSSNTRYLPEATWYLSLCYLQTGEYAEAMENLSLLKAYEGLCRDQSEALEKKIRRLKK